MNPRLQAEDLASRLPPLLVAAERVAATVAAGAHGRRRSGPGEAFWQFRPYQPGDAAAAIDWRQSARGDRLFVRENEWAAAQTVWLWVDSSASMDWRSGRALPRKLERARLLGLALAALLIRGGERVAPLGGGAPPMSGGGALARLEAAMTQPGAANLPGVANLPRHAEAVLVSDFLMAPAELEAAVRALAATGCRGHLVQVLDPAEETLPFAGRVRFTGLEDEGGLLVRRAEGVRDAYVRRLAAHRDALAAIAAAVGWSFALHHTDRPPQTALLALFARLSREAGR